LRASISQGKGKPSLSDYKMAVVKWESFSPPYTGSHIQSCVMAAKQILAYDGKPRRSKYEKANFLRIDFNKAGKVTFYAEFPKKLGVKGRKLGTYPELQPQVARNKAAKLADGSVTSNTVHSAIELFECDLLNKKKRGKLRDRSVDTYKCRTKKLKFYFSDNTIFSELRVMDIEKVLDDIIDNETASYAIELYAELRRVWRFAAPKFTDCKNVAEACADDYVSSRVKKTKPCRMYTDLDSISIFWNNLALARSLHQKNVLRYMIITGLRPINVVGLRWEWIDDELHPTQICYPESAMKNSKPFVIPVTENIRKIILEQRDWREKALPNCNSEYVFLKPSNPFHGFAIRSLDKLTKDYFPADGVLGQLNESSVKGKNGAFNTLCRKFVRTHVKAIYRYLGVSKREATDIAKLCVHHSADVDDPLADSYDFSEELYGLDYYTIKEALQKHENIVVERAYKLRETTRLSGLLVRKAQDEKENIERNEIRKLIRKKIGKLGYRAFVDSTIPGASVDISTLVKTQEGRLRVVEFLER